MVCRSVKYFPKQVQSENTNPGKWHRIVILQLIDEKLKKTIYDNRKFCYLFEYCNGLWFQQILNDITVESGL